MKVTSQRLVILFFFLIISMKTKVQEAQNSAKALDSEKPAIRSLLTVPRKTQDQEEEAEEEAEESGSQNEEEEENESGEEEDEEEEGSGEEEGSQENSEEEGSGEEETNAEEENSQQESAGSEEQEGSQEEGEEEEQSNAEEVEGEEGEHEEEALEEHVTEAETPEEAGETIEFNTDSDEERMKNFRKVADDLKVYEDEYSNCLIEIASADFSQETVDACVGKDFLKVILDIKYMLMRSMTKMDFKIRELFTKKCYSVALEDELLSVGCDLMEKDALNLMWTGLYFHQILDVNKQKYLFEYSKVPFNLFETIIEELITMAEEFFELIHEVDNHKELTILRLKNLIEDRTKITRDETEENQDVIEPVSHVITLSEKNIEFPKLQIENQSEDQFEVEGGYEGDRKLKRHPSRRVFNSSNKYEGLHGKVSTGRTMSQSSFHKNPSYRMALVNRLSKTDLAQGKLAFKNIHTSHFTHR